MNCGRAFSHGWPVVDEKASALLVREWFGRLGIADSEPTAEPPGSARHDFRLLGLELGVTEYAGLFQFA